MKAVLLKIALMATISLFGNRNLQTTDAFAAGKKNNKPKKKKGSKNVVGKGFGSSAGPTLEEVVAGIPNRIPSNPLECECPCGVFPGKLYKDCCEPFHSKEKLPASPMDVLRTRYTAFAVSVVFNSMVVCTSSVLYACDFFGYMLNVFHCLI